MGSFFQKCGSFFKILSRKAVIIPLFYFPVNFHCLFPVIGIFLKNTAVTSFRNCSTGHDTYSLPRFHNSLRVLSCVNFFHHFQLHRVLWRCTCKIFCLAGITVYRWPVKRRIVKFCHHILRQDSSPCLIQFYFFCLIYYRRILQNLFHCLFYADSLHALIPPFVSHNPLVLYLKIPI